MQIFKNREEKVGFLFKVAFFIVVLFFTAVIYLESKSTFDIIYFVITLFLFIRFLKLKLYQD